ncbi:MAG: type II secretion system F family protein [bacterium]|nr:type II secretion system F family protein [bacterium]
MSALLGLAALVALALAWSRYARGEQRVRQRITRALGVPTFTIRRPLRSTGPALSPRERLLQTVQDTLEQAAVPIRPEEYLRLVFAAVCGGAAFGLLVRGLGGALLIASTAAVVMWWWPQRRVTARRAQFVVGLPGALSSMAAALGAGLSVQDAIIAVARDAPDPVGPEFDRVAHAVQVGMPLQQAIGILSRRVRAPEIAYFATALRISTQTGADLAFILEQIAAALRARSEAAAELRALTAQGRMSRAVLTGLPVAVGGLFYLLDPAYGKTLIGTPAGWVILGLSGALLLVGWGVSKRITEGA